VNEIDKNLLKFSDPMRPKRPQAAASGLQYLRYCRPDEEPGGSTSSYEVAACAGVTVPSTTEGGAALMAGPQGSTRQSLVLV